MIIRQARLEDAPAIAAITNAIIRDTLVTFTTVERGADAIAADIEARGNSYLVAEQDGQVVGFATYGPFRAGPGYARCAEHTIQLAPAGRGHGAGRALMSALERVARRAGIHVLIAGISSTNPAAIEFHSAIGFRQVGRMPEVGRKWDQWLDLVLMQKIIDPQ
ncbi:phosphinothricin acetyltransferase [Ruegeria halocynthiae]|uniref:Phosphinothricin acetyltransferase n=1 Tax=Ruegeria halocynthiae TaxID=985054 RepID=A0A1H2V9L1_9RHOB|nr:GNAT family N-acetyltransferase [Ruegeria halocynthiae]SDW65003.1 phosphinothricin acetyltransferase [Ruegeria halocynthiae]